MENLEFLSDVVPKTTTYKQYKQKQAKEGQAAEQTNGLAKGQGTLDHHLGGAGEEQAINGANHEAMDVDDEEDEEGGRVQGRDDGGTEKLKQEQVTTAATSPEQDDDDDEDDDEEMKQS